MFMIKVTTSHAGHGGTDPGALGVGGRREADVVRRINKKFIALTGAKDCTVDYSTSVDQNLSEICKKMNAVATKSTDINISHHLNAFNGTANGVEVIYWEGSKQGKELATKLAKAISDATGLFNRGAKATKVLYVHRNTTAQTLLIEWGFIDNAGDVAKIEKNFDKMIEEAVKVFGYEVKKTEAPKEKAPSKPAVVKPAVNQKKVKVLTTATHWSKASGGKAIAKFVKGNSWEVKQERATTQSNSTKEYLIANKGVSMGWVLSQDIEGGEVKAKAKPQAWDNYYTSNPGTVVLKKADGLRHINDVDWTGNPNYGGRFPAGTAFKIKGIKKGKNGCPRLITQSGFLITANKDWVRKA